MSGSGHGKYALNSKVKHFRAQLVLRWGAGLLFFLVHLQLTLVGIEPVTWTVTVRA